jgi:aminopeptidase-like protein
MFAICNVRLESGEKICELKFFNFLLEKYSLFLRNSMNYYGLKIYILIINKCVSDSNGILFTLDGCMTR